MLNTVEAVYMMRRLGIEYSCLLYPLSLISVVQLTGPGRSGDRNMRVNQALSLIRVSHLGGFHCGGIKWSVSTGITSTTKFAKNLLQQHNVEQTGMVISRRPA